MEKDFEKAYLEEQEYLKDTCKRQLVDRLKDCGYDSLYEYFDDKRYFLLKSKDTYVELLDNDSLADIYTKVQSSMDKGERAVYLSFNKATFAWVGSADFDDEKAKELGLEVHKMQYAGGTIITGPDDLSGAIVIPKSIDVNFYDIIIKFRNFLISKGENAVLDNNDIMVDGKKVFGGASYSSDTMFCFLFEATFSDNLELIKQLCTIKKEPGRITKTNKEELYREVLTWLTTTI